MISIIYHDSQDNLSRNERRLVIFFLHYTCVANNIHVAISLDIVLPIYISLFYLPNIEKYRPLLSNCVDGIYC
jgi:hypothetical protein